MTGQPRCSYGGCPGPPYFQFFTNSIYHESQKKKQSTNPLPHSHKQQWRFLLLMIVLASLKFNLIHPSQGIISQYYPQNLQTPHSLLVMTNCWLDERPSSVTILHKALMRHSLYKARSPRKRLKQKDIACHKAPHRPAVTILLAKTGCLQHLSSNLRTSSLRHVAHPSSKTHSPSASCEAGLCGSYTKKNR